ncbi:MAG: di-trans,poly-cis-decaprenylcistransferase [Lachnospiraceae bacterium]|nr:di-trans,poly-cis-decaprenylcistransferase [Lachnospiraceae bacterium]
MEKELKHIAFIMDGNGRWAKKRGLPRHLGHKRGCEVCTDIYEGCLENHIQVMSLYAFSTENWNRPKDEIDHLFNYLEIFFKKEIKRFMRDGSRVMVSGDLSRIPEKTRNVIDDSMERTKDNKNFVFNICLNYGGKSEIIRATKLIAEDIKNGVISIDDVNEKTFENYLYTKDLPPVDLLIRTSGEMRTSNFLLWQLAYAEFIFTKTCWPDFNKKELNECINEFKTRDRRYGTRGYESETGRSNNISQDNAGLLAGATCGAGLGAIICANMGYPITFFASAVLFAVYLLITFSAMPWKALAKRGNMDEEEKPVSVSSLKKMIFSAEMLFYIVFIGIPLNIGVMLCVTLVPAICQNNGISSVMLSYCYIANGIAGIYIGPALVSRAKKKLGLMPCIAISFLLAAAGIFVLKLPGIVVMIVISSMVLGFLDGFGTPMCTDQFMELNVVKNAVDESTALIFSVVISYILLTFAPMIAEAMLLPGEGLFSPMMIGTAFYLTAAVVVFIYGAAKKKRSSSGKRGK